MAHWVNRVSDLRQLLPSARRFLSGVALVLAAAGCASSGGGGGTGFRSSEGTANSAAVAERTVISAPSDGFLNWIGLAPAQGPEAQRQHMLERAGTAHFQNADLMRGRVAADARREAVNARRAGLVSSDFVAAKASLRGRSTRPQRGEVLGPGSVGDPSSARAILAALAATQGVPVTQPALAYLFPSFGN